MNLVGGSVNLVGGSVNLVGGSVNVVGGSVNVVGGSRFPVGRIPPAGGVGGTGGAVLPAVQGLLTAQ